nr:hypothetical protein [Sedimentibacter sp.]
MKINQKIVAIGFVMMMLLSTSVFAVNASENSSGEVSQYIQDVKDLNDEISTQSIEDIPSTITLSEAISYKQLESYATSNNIEIVQVQARGIDSNGNRVTFASKVHRGFEETEQILREMADEEGIEFIGYNAMYALVDSKNLLDIQNNEYTFLVDTSAYKINKRDVSITNELSFPHSFAWELDDINE